MNFFELINIRYSVRAYKPDSVEDEKLSIILNAGRLAPTAGNRLPYQIIVIHTQGREEELLTIYPRNWFVQAPIILCVCGIPATAWTRRDGTSYLYVDIALVTDYLVLAATELGLGTCFVAAFNVVNARRVLSLPDEVEPILFTPLGYPDVLPGIRIRKNLEELVRYEHW